MCHVRIEPFIHSFDPATWRVSYDETRKRRTSLGIHPIGADFRCSASRSHRRVCWCVNVALQIARLLVNILGRNFKKRATSVRTASENSSDYTLTPTTPSPQVPSPLLLMPTFVRRPTALRPLNTYRLTKESACPPRSKFRLAGTMGHGITTSERQRVRSGQRCCQN